MESTVTPLPSKNLYLRYGLLASGLSILLTIIVYLVDSALFANKYLSYLSFTIVFVIAVLAAIRKKSEKGGYLSYGEGVVAILLVFLIGYSIYTVFSILLFTLIDPSLIAVVKGLQLEALDKSYDKGDLTKEAYDASISVMDKFGKGIFIFGAFMAIIVMGFFALIFALIASIFIRKEPEYNF